jgi:hypothetical protein
MAVSEPPLQQRLRATDHHERGPHLRGHGPSDGPEAGSVTGVADRAPERVLRLIYLGGLVPHHVEAAIELVGPQVRPELERQVRADGDGWLIPVQRLWSG